MNGTIVIAGFGSGISSAVARRFGKEGLAVALVGRRKENVDAGAADLAKEGITARGFRCDVGDEAAVKATIAEIHDALGPISVLHWNAADFGANDLLTATSAELDTTLRVAVHGLVAAVQAAHADLTAQKGAVLVTGGGLGLPDFDDWAVSGKVMGLALAKSLQIKTVGLLGKRLAADGIHVGQVIVCGGVKGTGFDTGQATIEASSVADAFWTLASERKETTVKVT